jgi:nucleotide-binding universal stress UspA family protein
MIALGRVLVALDFSPPSDVALKYGRALARTFGASLHVLHVTENFFLHPVAGDPQALRDAALQHVADRLTEHDRSALRAHAVVEIGDAPADAIVAYAKRHAIDLIVMGTHGRSAVSQVLVGSVAERVVRTAHCPVLTVRHPEREFVFDEVSHDRVEEGSCCH